MAVEYEKCPACDGVGRSRDGDSVLGPSFPCGYNGCHSRMGQFVVPVRVPEDRGGGGGGGSAPASRQPRVTVGAVIVSRILDSRVARRTIGVVVVTAALLGACAYWISGPLGWLAIGALAAAALVRVPRAPAVLAIGFVLGIVTGLLFSVAVFMFGPPRWMRSMTAQTPLIDPPPAQEPAGA